ncbi:MAG: UDP-N-acetylmuramoyl-tripeptide--D-alanyl-D-alanine ligase, partial [Prevotella sp.]|nr:UDP-N-acetylmuramoyl-tripeptide--D-alanyl-D-alanine ligase [Prevotella sp.]
MTIEELYGIYLENPNITTDSRNCPEHSIFFGIKGERFDGTQFGDAAIQNGAAFAVTEGDTLKTLQELANYHVRQLKTKGLKVIGITGTNGKTTTKELVSAVLQKKYNVLYTQGNFNNHLGVPLTLLRLREEHEIAVVEMGANHPGEIKDLVNIVEPHYGLITSVGRAHLEGFGSFEGVIKTKGELYDYLREHNGKVFLNNDNEYLVPIAEGIEQIPYVKGKVLECNPYVKFGYNDFVVQTQLIGNYN